MTKYISILRGINVGGKRKILMADLKALYEQLGFTNITTYIQSGNVLFDVATKENSKQIGIKISKAIFDKYGFEVPVIIRTIDEIEKAIKNNPFLKNQAVDTANLHLTFLEDIPDISHHQKIIEIEFPADKFQIIGKDVFIACAGKYSDSKLTNAFFESKLKVAATTRNWQTVNKLMELAVA